jgi:hypothetical protein
MSTQPAAPASTRSPRIGKRKPPAPKKRAPVHPQNPNWVSTAELSRWLGGQSVQATSNQAEAGELFPAPVKGYWLLFESVNSRVRGLREVAAGRRSSDGQFDVAAESAQLKRVQRERIELDLQERRGELIDAKDVVAVYTDLVREVRQAILGIPARVQCDLPHMVPSEVEVIKRQCRETLADLKRLGGKPPRVGAGAHRHAKRVL